MGKLNPDLKVLLVDDFSAMRKILRRILSELGIIKNVDDANNGVNALTLLNQNHYDIVLVDWNMPKMSGYDLLKAMKKDKNLKDIPVIMVTAEALKDNIIAAAQAGISGYITKPFTADELKEKFKEVLSKNKTTLH